MTAFFSAALLCSPVFSHADPEPAPHGAPLDHASYMTAAEAPRTPSPGERLSYLDPLSCPAEEAVAAIDGRDAFVFVAWDAADGNTIEEAGAGPDIPIVVNKNVESYVRYFQTGGRKYFEKWLDRSKDYMTMLRGILRENGLPEDLSYIAFIESGLNPTVKSKANAVGMWQFIRGTGRRYGLRVDWWIDERMDPEKATLAAAKYFKSLYGQFGSWYLAAAGYNAGEGKVMRMMKRHDSEDFWVLASRKRSFKRETRDYVPKFLAALMIGKDPTAYGFEERPEGERLYDKAAIPTATDLRVIAEATGATAEEIKKLNPELLRRFTPPGYPDYEVKIPYGTKDRFIDYMSKTPPSKTMAFIAHKVRRGESAYKIAKKYGASVEQVLYVNDLQNSKMRLKPSTVIMVPVKPGTRTAREAETVLTNHDFQG